MDNLNKLAHPNNMGLVFKKNVVDKKGKKKKLLKQTGLVIGGGVVGLINGLLGGGGGTFVVPLYESMGEIDSKKAHATAIATMLPLSIVSGAIYVSNGSFPIGKGLAVGVGTMIGGIIGALMLKKINTKLLSIVFYGIMIYAGIKMIM